MENHDCRDHWDADYRQRGNLYTGASRSLPLLPAGSRVLEIGCGNGKSLSAMVHREWIVTGIDFSPQALILARPVALQGFRADLVVADASSLPFHDGSFDAVSACHVLGHGRGDERRKMAAEIFRVLRPGKQLLFCDFSTRDFRYGSGRETEAGTYVRGSGILTHYFSHEEVVALFAPLVPVTVRYDEWSLRVRGHDYPRSEISATFEKPV